MKPPLILADLEYIVPELIVMFVVPFVFALVSIFLGLLKKKEKRSVAGAVMGFISIIPAVACSFMVERSEIGGFHKFTWAAVV